MEAKTKKKVIVIGSLLVIGGIVGYLLWKRKKDKENALTNTTPVVEETKVEETKVVDDKKPPVVVKSNQPVVTQQVPKTTPTPLPPKFVPKTKVNATDVLASNIKGGNARGLWATIGGLTIYNAGGSPTAKTVKGQRLGTVINAEKTTKGYWINFLGSGNVKYKVFAIPNVFVIEV